MCNKMTSDLFLVVFTKKTLLVLTQTSREMLFKLVGNLKNYVTNNAAVNIIVYSFVGKNNLIFF